MDVVKKIIFNTTETDVKCLEFLRKCFGMSEEDALHFALYICVLKIHELLDAEK